MLDCYLPTHEEGSGDIYPVLAQACLHIGQITTSPLVGRCSGCLWGRATNCYHLLNDVVVTAAWAGGSLILLHDPGSPSGSRQLKA